MQKSPFILLLLISYLPSIALIAVPEKPVLTNTGEGKESYLAEPRTIKSENRELWLFTAKISVNSTYKRDTTSSYKIESMVTVKEFHQSSQSSASSTISAVIENQAENPLKDFFYDSSSGEPVSMSVTGQGTQTETTKGSETINGTLISADERTDNVSGSALPDAYIQFSYSDDYKMVSVSVNINAKGTSDARLYDGEWKDYGGPIEDYGINCVAGCSLPDDKNCKITRTGKGYTASWSSSENEKGNTGNGTEYRTSVTSLEVTLVPYKESDKPEVTIEGCSELGVSEKGQVTAKASAEGGTYRFWAEPQGILTVESNGASATLQGSTPGRGKLYVEYTSPEGKTATTSMAAACVTVESYNGGQAVPQIPLFDIDGKKLPGILKIPFKMQPDEATDLLAFSAADPGVLSAVGLGDMVALQGIHSGKTTVQATTKCGGTAGPPVEVEVVNCDDETVAALERMKQTAMKNLLEANDVLKQIAGSKEFEKAREEIVKSLWNVFIKSGLTIVTSGKASGAQKVATEILDNGNALREIIASTNPEELKNNVGKTATGKSFEKIIKNQFGEVIEGLWGKSASAAIGVAEAQGAAQKFADNLNQTIDFERAVKNALETFEKCNKDLEKYTRLQQICRGEKPQPSQKEAPKTEPKPDPTKPTPPVTPATKTEEPPVQKSQTEEPTADDEVLDDPEPPVTPPRQVGLPYEADDCGCEKSKDLTVKSTDFSMLEVGMKNLGECVEAFRSTSLTDYQQALEELSSLTESLTGILNTDADAFLLKAKESMPQLDSIVNRIKAYDEAGGAFMKKMDKCPESLTTGMEIFQSVEKITVDSIKTNY